jgi:hypothetical protein
MAILLSCKIPIPFFLLLLISLAIIPSTKAYTDGSASGTILNNLVGYSGGYSHGSYYPSSYSYYGYGGYGYGHNYYGRGYGYGYGGYPHYYSNYYNPYYGYGKEGNWGLKYLLYRKNIENVEKILTVKWLVLDPQTLYLIDRSHLESRRSFDFILFFGLTNSNSFKPLKQKGFKPLKTL